MKHQLFNAARYIREKELLRVIPISKSTLWRKVASGTFPKPIKISAKVTAWKLSEIDDWFVELELTHGVKSNSGNVL